jgi:hypothetical protein
MTQRADLRARIEANAGVAAIVGGAVSWFEKNRKDGYPCVILNTIDPGRDWTHGGPSGLDEPRVQIDSYGKTLAEADALALAVRAAMESGGTFGGSVFGPGMLESEVTATEDEQDGGQRLYRVSQDYTFTIS